MRVLGANALNALKTRTWPRKLGANAFKIKALIRELGVNA